MTDGTSVDPDFLAACACATDQQCDALLAAHARTEARIEGALSGWAGDSQRALAQTTERWSALTPALCTAIHEYGQALGVSALAFARADVAAAVNFAGVPERNAPPTR